MYEVVKFEAPGQYRGKNGAGILAGIEVIQSAPGSMVTIGSVNSKGTSNSCWLFFDASEVPRLMELLQEVEIKKMIEEEEAMVRPESYYEVSVEKRMYCTGIVKVPKSEANNPDEAMELVETRIASGDLQTTSVEWDGPSYEDMSFATTGDVD